MKKTFEKWLGMMLVSALIFTSVLTVNAASQTKEMLIGGEKVKVRVVANNYTNTVYTEDSAGSYSFSLNKVSDTLTFKQTSKTTKQTTTQKISMKHIRKNAAKFAAEYNVKSWHEDESYFWGNAYYINVGDDETYWGVVNSTGDSVCLKESEDNEDELNNFKNEVDNLVINECTAVCATGVAIVGAVVATLSAPSGLGVIVGALMFLGGVLTAAPAIWNMYKSRDRADYYYDNYLK